MVRKRERGGAGTRPPGFLGGKHREGPGAPDGALGYPAPPEAPPRHPLSGRKGCYLLLPPPGRRRAGEKVGPLSWAWQEASVHPGRRQAAPPGLEEVGQPASVQYVLRERTERSFGVESPLCQHLRGCNALGTTISSTVKRPAVHCERLAPALFRVGLRGA